MIKISIVLFLFSICTFQVSAQRAEVEGIWEEGSYTADTTCLAARVQAVWGVMHPKNSKLNHLSYDANDLLKHFSKQAAQKRKKGIFIHSETFAVPDTEEERQIRSTLGYRLYADPVWRKSENELVAALQKACQQKRIPLYVNLSSNLMGKWKVLNRPEPLSLKNDLSRVARWDCSHPAP